MPSSLPSARQPMPSVPDDLGIAAGSAAPWHTSSTASPCQPQCRTHGRCRADCRLKLATGSRNPEDAVPGAHRHLFVQARRRKPAEVATGRPRSHCRSRFGDTSSCLPRSNREWCSVAHLREIRPLPSHSPCSAQARANPRPHRHSAFLQPGVLMPEAMPSCSPGNTTLDIGVLASMYPAVTVMLASVILKEGGHAPGGRRDPLPHRHRPDQLVRGYFDEIMSRGGRRST